MKDKLIPEWRSAWKMFSVWASVALTLLSLIQAEVIPLVMPLVPPKYWPWVTATVGVLIVVLRVIRQHSIEEAKPPK